MLNWVEDKVVVAPTFTDDITYARTFLELDTKPEFEMYELGHIGYVTWLMDESLAKKPPHLQFVFGAMVGWMVPSIKHHMLMYEETESMLGKGQFTWPVAASGKHQIPLAATAIAMGAPNVRVGLEDSVYRGKGKPATSSADHVKTVVNIATEMSLAPATSAEARELFGLKGIDKTGF